MSILSRARSRFQNVAVAIFRGLGGSNWQWSGSSNGYFLNRTDIDYASEVAVDMSSIVAACIGWIQRTFTEAPYSAEEWLTDTENWKVHHRHRVLALLNKPNAFYSGTTLKKALIADRITAGTAYIGIVRDVGQAPSQLWWLPESTITPVGNETDKTVFIDHYEYKPGDGKTYDLRFEDVIRMPDGMDPRNPRKGVSKLRTLFREIYTDDEAANMTASLMKNMGIPGVVFMPKGTTGIPAAAGKAMEETFNAKFTGDNKGKLMVVENAIDIHQFQVNLEQLQMRAIRGVPEERITAAIGVNAAVVGLGAGLESTKVGATLKEYREEALESTIMPMYREFAEELTNQLLPWFEDPEDWRITFDLTQVRVLQEDENKRVERLNSELNTGGISLAEWRRDLGRTVADEHNVYFRRRNVTIVPVGLSPKEQQELSVAAQPTAGRPPEAAIRDDIRSDVLEVLKGASR